MSQTKVKEIITLVGGGDESFEVLTAGISENKTLGVKFKAGVLTTTPITINLEINYDTVKGVDDWDALEDPDGNIISFTLASNGTVSKNYSSIPVGASIRPLFVDDSTGPITVTLRT